jgi:CRP/FNR family transcriptional regulator
MNDPGPGAPVLDFDRLRRNCAACSLHVLCLPAGIGAEDLHRLEEIVRNRRPLARGEHLYRAGQAMSSLYVAREGAFKTVALDSEGDEQVVGFHLPGELMGLDGMGRGRHGCDSVALTQATVCEIPMSKLEEICAEVQGLGHQLLRIIGQGIDRDQNHLEMLGRKQAQERVALFLHGLSERYRLLGLPGDMFTLPMSREDIASYLGLVIETVSRTLTRLQDEGVIAVRGRKLRILDRQRLDALVHAPASVSPRQAKA